MSGKPNLAGRFKKFRLSLDLVQRELARILHVSLGAVADWETRRNPIPGEVWLKLAHLASDRREVAELIRLSGASEEQIMLTAEKIQEERTAPPIEGEIFRVPIVERAATGNKDTGRLFPVPAHLLPNPASTIALLVHECCANRTLAAGDIIVLDTSQANTQKAAPFLNQAVVVDIDWQHERIGGIPVMSHERGRNSYMFMRHVVSGGPFPSGVYVGHLRCKRLPAHKTGAGWSHWVLTLSWANHFEGESEEAAEHELHVGDWFQSYDETAKTPEGLNAFEAAARKRAAEEITLEPHCAILGRVIAWFPAPEGKAEGGGEK